MPYIIYADIEFLINKIDKCANNPENSSVAQIGEHNSCGYSRKQTYFILQKRLYEHIL